MRGTNGDGLNPIAELDGAGDVRATFIYGTRAHVPDAMFMTDGTVYRLITDHVGSVRLVVNAETGEVVQRIDYDAFGRVLSDTNPGFQPFGLTGGLYDDDTGLVRFGARDYEAYRGRWTAKDPALFEGGLPNLYSYAGGDPLNRIDADGQIWGWIAAGAAILAAGYGLWRAINSGFEAAEKERNAKEAQFDALESGDDKQLEEAMQCEQDARKEKDEAIRDMAKETNKLNRRLLVPPAPPRP